MQENDDSVICAPEARGEAAAAILAFFLTILVHAFLFFAIPYEISFPEVKSGEDEFTMEVLPPQINKKKPEFVEANPYGNSSPPDSPDAAESFKDQRAADIIADPGSKSKMPYLEGEIKNGKKIVEGTSSPEDIIAPQEIMKVVERPLVRPAQPQDVDAPSESSQGGNSGGGAEAREGKEENIEQKPEKGSGGSGGSREGSSGGKEAENIGGAPIKGDDADSKDDDSLIMVKEHSESSDSGKIDRDLGNAGFGAEESSSEPSGNNADNSKLAPSGGQKTLAGNGSQTGRSPEKSAHGKSPPEEDFREESLPVPKQRPQLSMKIPAGPLADNRSHASRQGMLAVDSRFSEFGAYQQRMLEAISRQWNLLGSKYDLIPAIGTQVVIEFWLDKNGDLVRHKILFSNSTNTGRGLCEQSILTTAPYGEWTRDMLNVFGDSAQSVTITFHYR